MAINFPNSPTNGQEFTSGSTTWVYNNNKWTIKTVNAVTNDSMPVGAIMWFGGSSAPTAWLLCDGSAVSRSTYANLFAVVGTTYGSGNGSTTFNLPSISSTTGAYYIRFTTSVGVVSSTALATAPVGTMFDWPTTSSYPTGFLRADGSAVSRVTYADLFALCGTTYGSGDGSTTFNLPNLVAAGAGSPVKIIKATSSGVVEPSTVAHSATHGASGSDPITITLNQVSDYQTSRNVVINGHMAVAQRGTSSAAVGAAYYTADRWRTDASFGSCTQSIQNDAPTGSGLTKSLKMLVGVGASATTYDSIHINQKIEGQNLQHLCFGQASAKSITISFWVKSNVTGTYIFHINTNNSNRQYSSSYTISASGVWEKKSITITGDTVTAIVDNNTEGLRAYFVLSAGSFYANGAPDNVWANRGTPFWAGQTNFASATNNYWQITGVQLERGSVATPFEFEPFETTLRKCMRYFETSYSYGVVPGTNQSAFPTIVSQVPFYTAFGQSDGWGCPRINYKVDKRIGPAVTVYSDSGTANAIVTAVGSTFTTTNSPVVAGNEKGFMVQLPAATAGVAQKVILHYVANAEL